jgi:hypothetical protein
VPVEVRDFRRTVSRGTKFGARQAENLQPADGFVRFNLGAESLLEPLLTEEGRFRVHMYDARAMARTHGPGKHWFLVAREVTEADVIVNIPKLKTHKKAGMTGALKNLVGVNGNKEFLPHHRKGGSGEGGDCYEGRWCLKRIAETLFDRVGESSSTVMLPFLGYSTRACARLAGVLAGDSNLDGSWHGNDTVWRTVLDLNRIVQYGTSSGALADAPQRIVISLCDAIIGGEGEGPLEPDPVPSGFLSASLNSALLDWANAKLMGLDPMRIPLLKGARSRFRWALVRHPEEDVTVFTAHGEAMLSDLVPPLGHYFKPPNGWRGHCEAQAGALEPTTTH